MAQLISYEDFVLECCRVRLIKRGHPPAFVEAVLSTRQEREEPPERKECVH